MKFDLVVKDASAADVSRILALFGSTAIGAAIATSGPAIAGNGASDGDDDTTGDTAAQPGQLDGKGIPWDDRIHSTPATLTTKGVWRAKRGVTPQLVAQVEAELKARAAQQPVYQQPAPMFDAGTQQPVQQIQPAYQPQPTPQYQPQPTQQPVQQMQPAYQPQMQPGPAQQPVYQPQPTPQQPVQQMQPQPDNATNDPNLLAWGMQGDPVDFNGFMVAMQQQFNNRDANGQPLIEANYLASITPGIAAKFGVNLPAITAIGQVPGGGAEIAQYAVRLMRSHGRWK